MQLDPRILSNFQRTCPFTHRRFSGRRYLLPNRCQNVYANQDVSLQHRVTCLLGNVLFPDENSFARKAELINLLVALRYDLPVLFLDEDLAEALSRTDLPSDFRTSDCRFPWPAFRLQLPLSLDLGNRDPDRVVQFVDVALCERDDRIRLDPRFLDELQRTFGKVGGCLSRGFTHPSPMFYLCGLASSDETVSCAHAWENETLRSLAGAETTGERPGEERIRDLIFNVLILLSQYPLRIDLPPLEVVRPPKLEGAHLRPELARARFVGDLIKPIVYRHRPLRDPEEVSSSTHAPHWVRGYHKRVAYGKGFSLRRLKWILPYRTGEKEQEIEEVRA